MDDETTRMDQPVDILFISMPSRANSSLAPFGFVFLAGFLDKHTAFRNAIVEPKIPLYKELTPHRQEHIRRQIFAAIEHLKPRFLGFSLLPADWRDFLNLVKDIKARFSTTLIVAGGVLPTVEPSSLLFESSPVDVVVRGDGEIPCRQLLSDEPWDTISGLSWRANGTVHDNGLARMRDEIDYIPSYHKVDMHYYSQMWTNTIRPYYTKGALVFTSIGCPFNCTFCANANHYVRYKRLDVLMEELCLLKENYRVNSFFILDECFLAKKDRALEFCREYIKSGLAMPWAMQTRANLVTEELISILAKAGCVHISFGVESGSDEVLKRVNKRITVEQNLKAFQLCRQHGIKTFANILFNLPGETEHDIKLTKLFLKKARPAHVAMSLTVPLLGTQINKEYVNPPLKPEEYSIFSSNAYIRIVDPRFRLASHDLNLGRLMVRESIKYFLKTSFGLISFERWYLRGVLGKTSPTELVRAFLIKIYIQVRSYTRGILAVFRKN